MKPKVRADEGFLHLKYKLPQQIYTSNIYPRSSENGSSIVVFGHERGVYVVWRGGKHIKARRGRNRHEEDDEDAMDTADEGADEVEDEDPLTQFEEEEEEFDPAHPYRSIVQHQNLDLGTGVLHIAFPRLPRNSPTPLSPQLLREKMLVVLACTDSSIRLLTIPLTPPDVARLNKNLSRDDFVDVFGARSDWIDSLITIPSSQCHRSLPKGVSVALAQRPTSSVEGDDTETVDTDEFRPTDEWDVLIASHSADLSGKMLIHRIPISADGMHIEQPPADEILWRSERLAGPAASVQIYAPMLPAAQVDSSKALPVDEPRVLVAAAVGSVRIYECSSEASPDRGFWSLTLNPGYTKIHGQTLPRKILDAQWVLGGHAICTLMADGEWGIWDLFPTRLHKTISGHILTKFTLSGWLTTNATTAQKPSAQPKPESRSSLAPMTPNTRKTKQDTLFAKPSPQGAQGGSTISPTASLVGGISPQLTRQSFSGVDDDETLLLWHNGRTVLIPSLRSYFRVRAKTSSSDPFSAGASGAQPREMPSVAPALAGELRTAAAVFPADETPVASGLRSRTNDLLVVGQRGFVIVASPLSAPPKERPVMETGEKRADERALLAKGELGVDGLDRMLNDMADGGNASPSKGAGRRVGFAA